MVKGPDGKMVPDFAVDGKGANDRKKSAKQLKEAAMKLKEQKTPMKEDDVEAEIAKRNQERARKLKGAGYKGSMDDFAKLSADQQVDLQKLGSEALSKGYNSTFVNKKRNEILNPPTERTTGTSAKPMKKDAAMKLKEKPMKMKEKAAMKMGHSPKKMGHKK